MSGWSFMISKNELGFFHESADTLVFFGNKNSSAENLITTFPDYKFCFVQQSHSDVVVYSDHLALGRTPVAQGADAHFTKERRLALCIRTADCVPVLIHNPDLGLVAAVHAGWRGIENAILNKTINAMSLGLSSRVDSDNNVHSNVFKNASAWVGPHIFKESFEVGREVAEKLALSFHPVRKFSLSPEQSPINQHTNPNKAYVDLTAIAKAQLCASGITADRINDLSLDTFGSANHASFRRDGSAAGRQISFICLK